MTYSHYKVLKNRYLLTFHGHAETVCVSVTCFSQFMTKISNIKPNTHKVLLKAGLDFV
jgi:hypothetical protein